MIEEDFAHTDSPIIKDIRAYTQKGYTVLDEVAASQLRNTAFLTEEEEKWYQERLAEYRQEFGFKQAENF